MLVRARPPNSIISTIVTAFRLNWDQWTAYPQTAEHGAFKNSGSWVQGQGVVFGIMVLDFGALNLLAGLREC